MVGGYETWYYMFGGLNLSYFTRQVRESIPSISSGTKYEWQCTNTSLRDNKKLLSCLKSQILRNTSAQYYNKNFINYKIFRQ